MFACVVYLCVHQCIVEQYEPMVGEPPGVLQGQRSVAAFTNYTTLRETQHLLWNKVRTVFYFRKLVIDNNTCIFLI